MRKKHFFTFFIIILFFFCFFSSLSYADLVLIPGDIDGDCNVDRDDMLLMMAERNKSVAESNCGAPCDLDNDGFITVLDSRQLVLLCDQPRCAVLPPSCAAEPVDCEVSDWSVWTECTAECGAGEQSRTRTVITEPSNGGAECPELEETRACNGEPCLSEADCFNGTDDDGDGLSDCADDDCAGITDGECGTGEPGICFAGTLICVNSEETCVPDNEPRDEVCDNADNDCDGEVDEDLGSLTCGIGECERTVSACLDGQPQTCTPGNPANEVCDGLDNNCDGQVDNITFFILYYLDADGDGHGNSDISTQVRCEPPPDGYVIGSGDCDDDNANVHPLAIDSCDGIDNNCDGEIDNTTIFINYYQDADGDGFGNPEVIMQVGCEPPPEGYVPQLINGGDCNDENADVNPDAAEMCDGEDNDCDGDIDEGLDRDEDGTPDCSDGCPEDINKTDPGVCGCGIPDTDTDEDGTPDCDDGCIYDPNKTASGICGCGVSDIDSDGDGTPDCNDLCPADINKTLPGTCGCGTADTDSDEDGTPDCSDGCPDDPDKAEPGVCGCGAADADSDEDGTPDCSDNCPYDPDKTEPGQCGCGAAETDQDEDGTPDCSDGCPEDINKTDPGVCGCGIPDTDTDEDGTPDCDDGCIHDPNKTASGICGCGVSDIDSDGDGTTDCIDVCPGDINKTEPGICGCGTADTDSDEDGSADCVDNCPFDTENDRDGDGICGDIDQCPGTPSGEPVDKSGCSEGQSPQLTISITSPEEGEVLGSSPIDVSGTLNDPDARAMVQDVIADVSETTFVAAGIALNEGINTLNARARNSGGDEAFDARSVILDTTPPRLTIISPSERSMFTGQEVPIYITVDDATEVTCSINGAPALVDGGNVSGTAALQQGENIISADCVDEAANSSGKRLTLYLDSDPLRVADVLPEYDTTDVDPSTAVNVLFSKSVNSASVNSSTFLIRAGSSVLSGSISLSSDNRIATLTPVSPLPSGRIIDVIVTTGVRDTVGNPLSIPFKSSFTTAGDVIPPGVVIGEVYDDTRSLPLAGAAVEAIAADTGEALAQTVTDERGRYLINPGQSEVLIRVTMSGYTIVERSVVSQQGSYAEALDARLTPLAQPVPVTAVMGAEIGNSTGDLLLVHPGSLGSDGEVTFTSVSPQGPRRALPPGWVPLSIVDVISDQNFDPPVNIIMSERSGAASGIDAVFARFDELSGAWIALGDVTITEDGSADLTGVTGPGQFALLTHDTGEGGPAPAVSGDPLPEATLIPVSLDAEAVGTVTPPVGMVDDPTPARALVTITSETSLRSGTPLRGDFVQFFILHDGSRAAPLDTSQDLFAYRSPADPEGHVLEAEFPIAPSVVFSLTEAREGLITVTMQRSSVLARSLIGVNGGGVETDDGSRLIIPQGALPGDVPVDIRRLDDGSFPGNVPEGFTFIGTLELDLAGVTASVPLSLTLGNSAWRVPTGSSVVIAELRSVRGEERHIFTALARIDGDDLTAYDEVDGVTMPGVRSGGRYGFFMIDSPLAPVPGTARDDAGLREGHIIEIAGVPFISITGPVGQYVLVAPPGQFALTATRATNFDQAVVEGETGAVVPEIVIGATPPEVERITVRLPEVAGNFAGPVVLLGKPAPVIDDDNTGDSSGNGNGQIDAGERIELTLTVRNDGNVPVEDGYASLVVRNGLGIISVTPERIPIATLPADGPVETGPFVFDVPADADPSGLIYTFIYKTDGGLSSEMRFGLPVDADHLNVPVTSEIAVHFTEPVASESLNGLTLAKEEGAELVPVETNLIIGSGGVIARLRPVDPLDDDSVFRVTLTDAIIDRDGLALADTPYTERFRTEDLTPPMQINPGNIEMSTPDEEGYVTITGTIGTVNPDDAIFVLNEITGFTVLAAVFPDGSFEARLLADVTEEVVLIVRDYNGNETRVDPGPFVRRDPVTGEIISVILGPDGGTVMSDEGISLTVPVGAVPDAAEISLSYNQDPFTLPEDILNDPDLVAAFESLFKIIDRVNINADIRRFSDPVRFSVPPPDGSSAGDLYIIARSRAVTVGGPLADLDLIAGLTAAENPIHTLQRLEIIDSATVKDVNGELVLSSDSPPFAGITEPGDYVFFKVDAPLTFLAGEVRHNSVDGYPVRGAVVTSLPGADATSPFASVTDDEGNFVLADANAGGPYTEGMIISSRLDVFDPDYSRIIRRDVRAVVGEPSPPSTVIAHLEEPFVLPERLPDAFIDVLGDIEPPEVEIYIDGPSIVNGFSRVGDPLYITVVADDNDEISFLSLEIDKGGGFQAVSLATDSTYELTPLAELLIIFRAEARDPNGNITFTEALVRTVSYSDGEPYVPSPLPDRPPKRIPPPPPAAPKDGDDQGGEEPQQDPEAAAENEISFDGDVLVRFSEPLDPNTVNDNTVQLLDPEMNVVDAEILTELNNSVISIVPKGYLRLGACYTVRLSSDIKDLSGTPIEEEEFTIRVPAPVQVSTIELQDAKDVAMVKDTLVAVSRTGGSNGGTVNIYQVRNDEGRLLDEPVLLAKDDVWGRPNSLTSDGDLIFIGNSFMGAIATKSPIFMPYIPGVTDYSIPDIYGGCRPMFQGTLTGQLFGPEICYGLTMMWDSFPNPPSNIEVYDLNDPEHPNRIGGNILNYKRVTGIWNPNTTPLRLETTEQGVAVLNFMENIEFFSRTQRPQSLGVVERIYDYAQSLGRCDGGLYDGLACIVDYSFPPTAPVGQCSGGKCAGTTEFLDAVFFNGFAVILEKDGIRMLSTSGTKNNPLVTDSTIRFYPMSGTFVGRLGGVPEFEWQDDAGIKHITDLLFVSGQTDNRLTIINITNPSAPAVMSELPDTFGNMSFDACQGLAYIHGRNGEFHVIDFNDPENPVELNDPGADKEPFRVEGLGTGVGFNSNTNRGGVVYLARPTGVAVVNIRSCTTGDCSDDIVGDNDNCLGAPKKGISNVQAKANDEDDIIANLNEEVNFTVDLIQSNCPQIEYEWDFGDDNTSTEENPVHAYENGGEYRVRVKVKCNNCREEDTVIVGIPDLDIDSDNNNGSGVPDRTREEDAAEDVVSGNGKYILANIDDKDNDGIPDFADGFDRDGVPNDDDVNPQEVMARVIYELPHPVDISQARVSIAYEDSDPAGVELSGTEPDVEFKPGPGRLRIWAKGPREYRNKSSIENGGDFIPSGAYDASQLGFSGSKRIAEWYVEGISSSSAGGDQHIVIEVDPDGSGPSGFFLDAVKATVISVESVEMWDSDNRYAGVSDNGKLLDIVPPVVPFTGEEIHGKVTLSHDLDIPGFPVWNVSGKKTETLRGKDVSFTTLSPPGTSSLWLYTVTPHRYAVNILDHSFEIQSYPNIKGSLTLQAPDFKKFKEVVNALNGIGDKIGSPGKCDFGDDPNMSVGSFSFNDEWKEESDDYYALYAWSLSGQSEFGVDCKLKFGTKQLFHIPDFFLEAAVYLGLNGSFGLQGEAAGFIKGEDAEITAISGGATGSVSISAGGFVDILNGAAKLDVYADSGISASAAFVGEPQVPAVYAQTQVEAGGLSIHYKVSYLYGGIVEEDDVPIWDKLQIYNSRVQIAPWD